MGFLPSLIGSGGRPYVFFFGFSNPSGDTSRAISPNKFPRVWNRPFCKSIWLVEAASVRSCPSTTTRLFFAIPGVDCTVEVGLVLLRPEIRGFPGFHLQRWVSTQFSGRHRTAILLASYSQEQLLFLFARSYWPMTSSANMSLSWTIPIWLKSSLGSINTSSKLRRRTS